MTHESEFLTVEQACKRLGIGGEKLANTMTNTDAGDIGNKEK